MRPSAARAYAPGGSRPVKSSSTSFVRSARSSGARRTGGICSVGSLRNALREAGFDVPIGEERLERAVEQGAKLSRQLKRLPRFGDWAAARKRDSRLPSEWQVYRLAGGRRGAWTTFQYLVRSRLLEQGFEVQPDGAVKR